MTASFETAACVSTDRLGTLRRITTTQGYVTASHDYYPFGQEATNPYADTERLKFTGHERDLRDTTKTTDDLDYMHARYYHLNIARFLSTDPILGNPLRPQTFNPYGYVANNPLNFFDPVGLEMARFTDSITVTADDPDKAQRARQMMLRMILYGLFRVNGSNQVITWHVSFPRPPGVDLGLSIRLAADHRVDTWNQYRNLYNTIWMINRVRTGSVWDVKKPNPELFAAFGNFHYGVVTAAAGWDPFVAHWGAGAYSTYSMLMGRIAFRREWVFPLGVGTNVWQLPTLMPPHGDDPDDQFFTSLGFDYQSGAVQEGP